jgi:RNA polymerase sigma factor (TIGR02999 family)
LTPNRTSPIKQARRSIRISKLTERGPSQYVRFVPQSARDHPEEFGGMNSLTHLIEQVAAGDLGAREQLFAAAYSELRKLARSRLRDGGRNTFLETTALVHESYLRFIKTGQLRIEDRRAFFAYASKVMRSVIIDSVRERQAERRGGDLVEMTLDTQVAAELPSGEAEIMHVHDALLALEQAEPRLAQVVEMRYFGGYSEAEIAETLGLTERTVRRDWDKARLLLMSALKT